MGTLFVMCPECGRSVSTGIETDAETFEHLPDTPVKIACADCGTVTQYHLRTGWIEERTYPAGF